MEFFDKLNSLSAKDRNKGSFIKAKEPLRSAHRLGITFTIYTLLISCTSDPVSLQRKQVSNYIKEGNNLEAFNVAFPLATENWIGAENMRDTLNDNPSLKSEFPKFIRLRIDGENEASELIELKGKIERAFSFNILTKNDRDTLIEHLSNISEDANKTGKVEFLLSDDYGEIPSLSSNEASSIIFKRSVDALKERSKLKRLDLSRKTFLYVERKGISSPEYAQLKDALPRLQLSIKELIDNAEKIYPDAVRKIIAERSLVVEIITDPDDRLLKEDIASKLNDRSQAIVIALPEQKPAVNILLKRLQWEEIRKPDKIQSVFYAQHEVNLLSAALLMPKNSTYLYDVLSGGAELNYAFEIKITDSNGKEVHNALVRDQISKEWRSCSRPRIQNIFGGIQPANFIANDHMQNVCSAALPPSNSNWIRDSALDNIVISISKAKPIEQVIKSNE